MALAAIVLAVAAVAVAAVPLVRVSAALDRLFTRVSLGLFGQSLRSEERVLTTTAGVDASKVSTLRGAHIAETYRVYAAKTYLYAGVVGAGTAIGAVYATAGVVRLLGVPEAVLAASLPDQLAFLAGYLEAPTLSTAEAFAVALLVAAAAGGVVTVAVYQYRWYRPTYRGNVRERQIEESLPGTVAFIYALSRSGMEAPEIMRVLADNEEVYGETAREIEVVVRDIDVFGTNVVSALQRLSTRTPSEEFADFAENFVSVLQGGRDLSGFLSNQYEYYEEEAAARQEQFLELLATLAEAYVTVLVAGPLFLITILVVIGFAIGDTLGVLRALVYVLIPLATLGFLVYLDSLTAPATITTEAETEDPRTTPDVRSTADPDSAREGFAADGGAVETDARFVDGRWYPEPVARNVRRLAVYNRLEGLRRRFADPVGYVLREPTAVLYVAVPVAALYAAVRTYLLVDAGTAELATLDDVAVHAVLLIAGPFAVAHETRNYRTRAIERAVPDFLDRLASVNEAGMPIVRSFERIQRSNLGALDDELQRMWADIELGARLEVALGRLDERLDTPSVSRAVTLISQSMKASGDLAPVLRIAAEDALSTRRLARRRRQELLTYTVIIYVSFLVFLVIVVALTTIFLPAVPTVANVGSGPGAGSGLTGGGLSEAKKQAYQLVFEHSAVIQGGASGLMAGKMSEGSVKDGAKHLTVMVALAYGLVTLFL